MLCGRESSIQAGNMKYLPAILMTPLLEGEADAKFPDFDDNATGQHHQ